MKRWQGEVALCIGSGPSLVQADVEAWRGNAHVIVCNTSFKMCPWADVLLAVDYAWWDKYNEETVHFKGERWTTDAQAQRAFNLQYMPHSGEKGLATAPGIINGNGLTGTAALGFAYQFGVRHIVLLGYDMQLTRGHAHWHGYHGPGLRNVRNPQQYRDHLRNFDRVVKGLERVGIGITNCTRETAITSVERMSTEAAISLLRRSPEDRAP